MQPQIERTALAGGGVERRDQTVERPVLAEVQELLFAVKVVVQIGGREVGGYCDVAHAGGRKTALAENAGGGAQNVEAAPVRPAPNARRAVVADPIRTTVRKPNHGSIVQPPAPGRQAASL